MKTNLPSVTDGSIDNNKTECIAILNKKTLKQILQRDKSIFNAINHWRPSWKAAERTS